ncbi:50S ribosomal protein L16 [bacterium]|nr:MAG: 50S ribosomal protein L16 [bacterium]
MLAPKKTKYRKSQKRSIEGKAKGGTKVSFGDFGLQAVGACKMTSAQIESARRTITRFVQRGGKLWIRIFPDSPATKHGEGQTMGGGKGAVDHYVAIVKSGRIIFEMSGVQRDVAKRALELASFKLPIKTRFVERTV